MNCREFRVRESIAADAGRVTLPDEEGAEEEDREGDRDEVDARSRGDEEG